MHPVAWVAIGLAPLTLAQRISTSARCGPEFGLTCKRSAFGDCCSQYSYCGSTDAYCGQGCQSGYGDCKSSPISSSSSIRLTPSSTRAASPSTPSASLKVSTNARCGSLYSTSPKGMTCVGSKWGNCCSQYSWCGSTDAYCGEGCQPGFGSCKASASKSSSQLRVLSISVRPSSSRIASTSTTQQPNVAINLSESFSRSYMSSPTRSSSEASSSTTSAASSNRSSTSFSTISSTSSVRTEPSSSLSSSSPSISASSLKVSSPSSSSSSISTLSEVPSSTSILVGSSSSSSIPESITTSILNLATSSGLESESGSVPTTTSIISSDSSHSSIGTSSTTNSVSITPSTSISLALALASSSTADSLSTHSGSPFTSSTLMTSSSPETSHSTTTSSIPMSSSENSPISSSSVESMFASSSLRSSVETSASSSQWSDINPSSSATTNSLSVSVTEMLSVPSSGSTLVTSTNLMSSYTSAAAPTFQESSAVSTSITSSASLWTSVGTSPTSEASCDPMLPPPNRTCNRIEDCPVSTNAVISPTASYRQIPVVTASVIPYKNVSVPINNLTVGSEYVLSFRAGSEVLGSGMNSCCNLTAYMDDVPINRFCVGFYWMSQFNRNGPWMDSRLQYPRAPAAVYRPSIPNPVLTFTIICPANDAGIWVTSATVTNITLVPRCTCQEQDKLQSIKSQPLNYVFNGNFADYDLEQENPVSGWISQDSWKDQVTPVQYKGPAVGDDASNNGSVVLQGPYPALYRTISNLTPFAQYNVSILWRDYLGYYNCNITVKFDDVVVLEQQRTRDLANSRTMIRGSAIMFPKTSFGILWVGSVCPYDYIGDVRMNYFPSMRIDDVSIVRTYHISDNSSTPNSCDLVGGAISSETPSSTPIAISSAPDATPV